MNKIRIRIFKYRIKYKSYKTKSPKYWTAYNNKILDELSKMFRNIEMEYL